MPKSVSLTAWAVSYTHLFCKAALKGASLNVYINTKSMADRGYAEELNKKADAMLEKYTKIADETFDSVLSRLK